MTAEAHGFVNYFFSVVLGCISEPKPDLFAGCVHRSTPNNKQEQRSTRGKGVKK